MVAAACVCMFTIESISELPAGELSQHHRGSQD
jgi:hypothetical protein